MRSDNQSVIEGMLKLVYRYEDGDKEYDVYERPDGMLYFEEQRRTEDNSDSLDLDF